MAIGYRRPEADRPATMQSPQPASRDLVSAVRPSESGASNYSEVHLSSTRLEVEVEGVIILTVAKKIQQVAQRVFVNDVIVRFHKSLELEEDEVKTLICRYPPPSTIQQSLAAR